MERGSVKISPLDKIWALGMFIWELSEHPIIGLGGRQPGNPLKGLSTPISPPLLSTASHKEQHELLAQELSYH